MNKVHEQAMNQAMEHGFQPIAVGDIVILQLGDSLASWQKVVSMTQDDARNAVEEIRENLSTSPLSQTIDWNVFLTNWPMNTGFVIQVGTDFAETSLAVFRAEDGFCLLKKQSR
jgi:hypothetical protein